MDQGWQVVEMNKMWVICLIINTAVITCQLYLFGSVGYLIPALALACSSFGLFGCLVAVTGALSENKTR